LNIELRLNEHRTPKVGVWLSDLCERCLQPTTGEDRFV
jgi:hypothetical protein